MITRARDTIQRDPTAPTRTRQAIDDVRDWISRTPRWDSFGYSTAQVNSAAGGTDTTLFSTTIPAGSIATNGDTIRFEVSLFYAATAASKRVRVIFGSTALYDSGLLAITTLNSLVICGTITRIGASSQRYHLTFNSSFAGFAGQSFLGTASESYGSARDLKVVGNGTNLADLFGHLWNVWYLPQP